MLGDNDHTLSRDCHEQIEAGSGISLRGVYCSCATGFSSEALDLRPCISSIQSLHSAFGNTLSTTFYRFIETVGHDRPIVGLISGHPHLDRRPLDFDPLLPCRHHIRSSASSPSDFLGSERSICFLPLQDIVAHSAVVPSAPPN